MVKPDNKTKVKVKINAKPKINPKAKLKVKPNIKSKIKPKIKPEIKPKILLMYPNFKWAGKWEARTLWGLHPYNLMLLSAMIDKKYDVTILDANWGSMTEEQFADYLRKEKPELIGISVLTNEYGASGLAAARIAKEVDASIKTVMGGVYATSDYDNIISYPHVDYVIIGEGEYTLKELCDHLFDNGEFPKAGILYKEKDKNEGAVKIINTGRREFIQDLDALPIPSYHKVDFLRYANSVQRDSVDRARAYPYAHVFTSRGCPFRCCFCAAGGISGRKIRYRSAEHMLAEIEFLMKQYGIKSFIIDDDNILTDKERARSFFKLLIDKNLGLKWNAVSVAVFKLNEEMLELMKKSGCQYVNIAIESGVPRVLRDIIHKPVDLEHAKRMVKKMKELSIDVAANYIIGFPGEKWIEIRQTIRFAEELDADYSKIFIATPLPNTELYEIVKTKGYLTKSWKGFNEHLWTDGYIETDEFRPQDLKILRAYEWDRVNFAKPEKRAKILTMMGVTEQRLNEIIRNTFKRANP